MNTNIISVPLTPKVKHWKLKYSSVYEFKFYESKVFKMFNQRLGFNIQFTLLFQYSVPKTAQDFYAKIILIQDFPSRFFD